MRAPHYIKHVTYCLSVLILCIFFLSSNNSNRLPRVWFCIVGSSHFQAVLFTKTRSFVHRGPLINNVVSNSSPYHFADSRTHLLSLLDRHLLTRKCYFCCCYLGNCSAFMHKVIFLYGQSAKRSFEFLLQEQSELWKKGGKPRCRLFGFDILDFSLHRLDQENWSWKTLAFAQLCSFDCCNLFNCSHNVGDF